jgi:hypothetical protein
LFTQFLTLIGIVLGGVMVIMPGSNLVKDNGFLRVIKIHSMSSFGGEIKLLAPCLEILRYIKEP